MPSTGVGSGTRAQISAAVGGGSCCTTVAPEPGCEGWAGFSHPDWRATTWPVARSIPTSSYGRPGPKPLDPQTNGAFVP